MMSTGSRLPMHLSTPHRVTRAINPVRAALVLTLSVFMSQCLYFNAAAYASQVAQTAEQSREERVRKILESLEPDNSLRFALERGKRGSGSHYVWMDMMQQYGVKQASFRINFRWGKQSEKLKVTSTSYLRQYYRFDKEITDQSIIEPIRISGLEQQLHDEILRRARANLAQRMLGSVQEMCGTLYLNLLDDEVLPVLDEMPDLDKDCKTMCEGESVPSQP